MEISIQAFTGTAAKVHKAALAALRVEVFKAFPYLYDATPESEEEYLETFMQAESSILVVAFDQDKVIGVSTGLPLKQEAPEIQKDWLEGEYPIEEIFYFSGSVLKKEYRGKGIRGRLFEEREKWAMQQNYKMVVFCGVIRPLDDPNRPPDYVPLDQFWQNRAYQRKEGFQCTMLWKDIGEAEESEKRLQFWYKKLNSAKINQLFVYGTLGPGRPNAPVLEKIGGSWQEAKVRGHLYQEGWGADMGFPGIKLHKDGEVVKGWIFSSENLSKYWAELDAFEGAAYERVLAEVALDNNNKSRAYIYVLK